MEYILNNSPEILIVFYLTCKFIYFLVNWFRSQAVSRREMVDSLLHNVVRKFEYYKVEEGVKHPAEYSVEALLNTLSSWEIDCHVFYNPFIPLASFIQLAGRGKIPDNVKDELIEHGIYHADVSVRWATIQAIESWDYKKAVLKLRNYHFEEEELQEYADLVLASLRGY